MGGEDVDERGRPAADDSDDSTTPARAGLNPARPWERDADEAGAGSQRPAQASSVTATNGTNGLPVPTKAWTDRAVPHPRPAAPVPSHPDVVLRGLAAGIDGDGGAGEVERADSQRADSQRADVERVDRRRADVESEPEPVAPARPRPRPRVTSTGGARAGAAVESDDPVDSADAEPAAAGGDRAPGPAQTADASAPRQRRALGWLLARSPAPAEPDPPAAKSTFTLPEPDPELVTAWAQPVDEMRPTRDWTNRRGVPPPASRPRPAPRSVPAPPRADAPTPTAAPTGAPTPAPRRPRPRSHSGSPPHDPDDRAGRPATAEQQVAPPAPTYRPPDISRFLAATEPHPGDDIAEPRRRRVSLRKRAGSTAVIDSPGTTITAPAKKKKRKNADESTDSKPTSTAGKGGRSWVRTVVRLVVIVGIAVLAAVLLRIYVVQPYYIPSASMEPTLHGCPGCNDDRILVDKLSYRSHQPTVQDIVVFHRPAGDSAPESVLIKRVIGQGGDTVTLRNGLVYVNGLALNESYVNKKCGARPNRPLDGTSRWVVPQNSIFVMGDNRCDSHDSRAFGPIKDSSVIGRAFAIYWPLGRAGTL